MHLIYEWCQNNNVQVEPINCGSYHRLQARGVIVEYWPSSGRLVLNKRWSHAKIIFQYNQVIQELEKVIPPASLDFHYNVRPAYMDRLDELLA